MTSARTVASEAMVQAPARRYNVRPMATSRITWRDVQQQTPEDGKRREAIGGDLWVSAAPSIRHQRVSGRLERALRRLLEDPGHGEVFDAPTGVEFPETGEGVQPDLLFVSRERRGIVAPDWLRGAPDLVVEIVSPTTEQRDRELKRDLYGRQGVGEYWVVDPEEDAVEVWRFGGGATHERFTDRLPVRVGGEVVGEVDLEEVFGREA
ncbi:MAG: Uma2 family endonuclease [Gemmatimonadota bacterium]